MPPRTAKEVIDQAIAENKFGERLCYAFAVIVFLAGIVTLILGLVRADGMMALAGVVSQAFFLPAIYLARRIRQENLMIRLYEIPLRNAKTAQDAADAITKVFQQTFIDPRASEK